MLPDAAGRETALLLRIAAARRVRSVLRTKTALAQRARPYGRRLLRPLTRLTTDRARDGVPAVFPLSAVDDVPGQARAWRLALSPTRPQAGTRFTIREKRRRYSSSVSLPNRGS